MTTTRFGLIVVAVVVVAAATTAAATTGAAQARAAAGVGIRMHQLPLQQQQQQQQHETTATATAEEVLAPVTGQWNTSAKSGGASISIGAEGSLSGATASRESGETAASTTAGAAITWIMTRMRTFLTVCLVFRT